MQKIIFATGNQNKMVEIRQVLAGMQAEILSLKDVGIDVDIVEDGKTFEENALIKVKAIHELLPEGLILADDSGLEVDYMDKAPGIYSARFLGYDTSYDYKNQYIIDQLKDAVGEERSARFVCAIAAAFPNGETAVVRGTIEGQIAYAPSGNGGFGYDPIFYLPERGCTTADLSAEDKNAISHRGNALRMMRPLMEAWLQENRG